MRILIAEDDSVSRLFISKFFSCYGECDVTVDGLETLDKYLAALQENKPYDLICLDIMMPKVDGVKVLKAIRKLETQKGFLPEKQAKVIMITALTETKHIKQVYEIGCDGYASKPVDIEKLIQIMKELGFVQKIKCNMAIK